MISNRQPGWSLTAGIPNSLSRLFCSRAASGRNIKSLTRIVAIRLFRADAGMQPEMPRGAHCELFLLAKDCFHNSNRCRLRLAAAEQIQNEGLTIDV
jgi:hypothetical protein